MNGKPRDQLSTDIAAGRSALSPSIDKLTKRVAGLLSSTESQALWAELEARARRSPAYMDWLHAPSTYLVDLDPQIAGSLERYLDERLVERLSEARERGWEIEE